MSSQLQRATQAGLFQRLAGAGETIDLVMQDVKELSQSTYIEIKFSSVGGVFTKASTAGTIVDVIPRVEPRGGSAELILPAISAARIRTESRIAIVIARDSQGDN